MSQAGFSQWPESSFGAFDADLVRQSRRSYVEYAQSAFTWRFAASRLGHGTEVVAHHGTFGERPDRVGALVKAYVQECKAT